MKRVADTSRAARVAGAPMRSTREFEVLEALRRYRSDRGTDPTAYELLRWMQTANPDLDLNAVRPRLTELADAGRVRKSDKRRCLVTDKHVYTWVPVTPSPVPVPYVQLKPIDAAVQGWLL